MTTEKNEAIEPTSFDLICGTIEELGAQIAPTIATIAELKIKLLAALPIPEGDEGSQTLDQNFYKIETKHGFRRTPDQKAIQALFNPSNKRDFQTIALIFPQVYKLDLKQYRAAETMNPALFKKVAAAVTTKPSKPSIKVTRLPSSD